MDENQRHAHCVTEFSADETQTIKHLLEDWGFEYGLRANSEKVVALALRLGLNDLARRLR